MVTAFNSTVIMIPYSSNLHVLCIRVNLFVKIHQSNFRTNFQSMYVIVVALIKWTDIKETNYAFTKNCWVCALKTNGSKSSFFMAKPFLILMWGWCMIY